MCGDIVVGIEEKGRLQNREERGRDREERWEGKRWEEVVRCIDMYEDLTGEERSTKREERKEKKRKGKGIEDLKATLRGGLSGRE
jgi:hypothetical protein